jgi:predicted transcriptional regulator
MEMGLGISEIARPLGRYRTTIHREIPGDADAADHAALVPPYRSGDGGTSPIVTGSFECNGFWHS